MAEPFISKAVAVFVSYAREDSAFTKKLVQDLRDRLGHMATIWFDRDIPGGQRWWQRIMREIPASDIYIAVRSGNARRSPWVNTEIDMAWNQVLSKPERGRIIIPVVCKPMRKERPDLELVERISFSSSTDISAFNELLQIVKSHSARLSVASSKEQATRLQAIINHPTQPLSERSMPVEQELEDASGDEDEFEAWRWIGDALDALEGAYPPAMIAHFYHMRGLSYLYADDVQRAQEMLGQALELTGEPAQRLTILDEYTSLLVTQQRWEEVLHRAEEALAVFPGHPVWQFAKQEALNRIDANIYSSIDKPSLAVGRNDKVMFNVSSVEESASSITVGQTDYRNRRNQGQALAEEKFQMHLTDEKETMPGHEDVLEIDADREEVVTRPEFCGTEMSIAGQGSTVEDEHRKIMLQRARLDFERERLMSALEISQAFAEKLYPDHNEQQRAVLTRQFLRELLPLGISKQIDVQSISSESMGIKRSFLIRNRVCFTPARPSTNR